MKTRTFVLSGDQVDDFDLVMAISEAAAKFSCSFEGQEAGDKIERCIELEDYQRRVYELTVDRINWRSV